VYAWYFKQIPTLVPTEDFITWQGLTLFYVGISPSKPTHERKAFGRFLQEMLDRFRDSPNLYLVLVEPEANTA